MGTAIGVAGALGAAALASGALTVLVARAVIVPPSRRTEDVRILRVDLDRGLIVLSATPDSCCRAPTASGSTRMPARPGSARSSPATSAP
ncbi:hypothetical protein [Pseudolysinimonas kribbensis]|uniref:hypothetical protein n=1 Tax=Pseudolysinimonas kribbensis TaxID=433641 RepID=UPI0024E1301F|nr:hypothetical protein [Pseudolysinimonas kribbensis]